MYPTFPEIMISITTKDGELLDRFPVCHWQQQTANEDEENIGSIMSEHLLVERIKRYLKTPKRMLS